jgi:hypothetical protein
MSKRVLLSALLLQAMAAFTQTPAAQGKPSISFEKWLSVRQTGTVVLSPEMEPRPLTACFYAL